MDLKYEQQSLKKDSKEIDQLKHFKDNLMSLEQMNEIIASKYAPKMSFYSQFEKKGGVSKII